MFISSRDTILDTIRTVFLQHSNFLAQLGQSFSVTLQMEIFTNGIYYAHYKKTYIKFLFCIRKKKRKCLAIYIFLLFQTSDTDDLDLEVSDIEVPDYDLEADFDVPDVDFNVSDI